MPKRLKHLQELCDDLGSAVCCGPVVSLGHQRQDWALMVMASVRRTLTVRSDAYIPQVPMRTGELCNTVRTPRSTAQRRASYKYKVSLASGPHRTATGYSSVLLFPVSQPICLDVNATQSARRDGHETSFHEELSSEHHPRR